MPWVKKIQLQLTASEAIIASALESMRPSGELELTVIADTLHHVQTAYENYKKKV